MKTIDPIQEYMYESRQALASSKGRNFSEKIYNQRKEIYFRVYENFSKESKILRKARALTVFLKEKDIVLLKGDIIAGHQQRYDFSDPEYRGPYNYMGLYDSSDSTLEQSLFEISRKTIKDSLFIDEFKKAMRVGLFGTWIGGHVIADYESVLRKGFTGLRINVEEKLKEEKKFSKDFLNALAIVCMGAELYIDRYAEKAKLLAESEKNKKNKKNLYRISEACKWVSKNPPRTFFEAIQLFWLTHEILTTSQPTWAVSIGRFDQFMWFFYIEDLKKKSVTAGEAQDLIEELWKKFDEITLSYQNLIIGGQDINGEDTTNDLSYMCLRATEKLKVAQPALSVRHHSKTPEEFFDKSCRVIRKGGGLPAIFNDEAIIPAMVKTGIPLEDAINYGIVGCVEPTVPGKEFTHTEALRINWVKIMELMLGNGVCTVTREKIEMKNKYQLNKIKSFDDFYKLYKQELRHFIKLGAETLKMLDKNFSKDNPYPFLSLIMDGCIENGKDVGEGGTKYNFTSINGCGIANTVDSLAAIKKIVYSDRIVTLKELKNALDEDFAEHKELREILINKPSKFGNDDDRVDLIMKDLIECFAGNIKKYKISRAGGFKPGLYTVGWHIILGKATGATPDGRLSGDTLANSSSPVQGRDKHGPTAVISSILKFDHKILSNGMVFDLKFTPQLLDDEEGFKKFKDLLNTYFRSGGMEAQINVVDRKTLIEAQKKPEEYQNLIVRVSGYSAYFVLLGKEFQDEIISRAYQE